MKFKLVSKWLDKIKKKHALYYLNYQVQFTLGFYMHLTILHAFYIYKRYFVVWSCMLFSTKKYFFNDLFIVLYYKAF